MCPKHLNLKAEDYVCSKVDVECVDNGKLWELISRRLKRVNTDNLSKCIHVDYVFLLLVSAVRSSTYEFQHNRDKGS